MFDLAISQASLPSAAPKALPQKPVSETPEVNGVHTNGVQTNGERTNGVHTNGVHTNGVHTNGVHTNGVHTNGIHSNGVHTNGVHTNGVHANGVHTNGVHTNGAQANGVQTNGIQTNGVHVNGSKANGVNDSVVNGNGVHVNGVNGGVNGISRNGSLKAEHDTLFSPNLISAEVGSLLPEGYTIRPLRRTDFYQGFLDTLRVLTTVGEPSYATFVERYNFMASVPSTYFIIVILDPSSTIVGTGCVVVERKFIHNMGMVGHIEDIAVAKNQQGKKLGLRIIQALDHIASQVGCYKSILDCSEANEGFYVKCGFKRAGLEMAHYY